MINSFSGQYDFLSNFYVSLIIISQKEWKTTEHIFQAAKIRNKEEREAIRKAPTPGKAKRLGHKAQLRDDWEDVKDGIMLKTLRLKFKLGSNLAERLLQTGDEYLIEGNNWHDNYFGDCHCEECSHIEGKNILGQLLMQVRYELRVQNGSLYLKVVDILKAKGYVNNICFGHEKNDVQFVERWEHDNQIDLFHVLIVQTKFDIKVYSQLTDEGKDLLTELKRLL